MKSLAFSAEAILGALEGVCYITNPEGVILHIGERNWTHFSAAAGCQKSLNVKNVIGRNLFDYIVGRDVVESCRKLMAAVVSNPKENVSFLFRCDGPHTRREMRMNMSAIPSIKGTTAVLFQSLTLDERMRPPVNLFDTEIMMKRFFDVSLPVITLCSFCHDVAANDAGNIWTSAEIYYAAGGTEQVRLSHGICPSCYDEKIPAEG